jgi:hypothetical protein
VSAKANEPDGTLDWLRVQRSEAPEGMSERPVRYWDGHLRLALMEQPDSIRSLLSEIYHPFQSVTSMRKSNRSQHLYILVPIYAFV